MTDLILGIIAFVAVVTFVYMIDEQRGYYKALDDINESGWTVTRKK